MNTETPKASNTASPALRRLVGSSACNPISHKAEMALFARFRAGDAVAGDEIISVNLRFCLAQALRYAGGPVSVDDLFSFAVLGLIRARDDFDPALGYKFISYAVNWINARLAEHTNRWSRNIRIPYNQVQKLQKQKKVTAKLEQEMGRTPDRHAIAKAMPEANTTGFVEAIAQENGTSCVDTVVGPHASSLYDIYKSPDQGDHSAEVDANRATEAIGAALARLNDREALVLEYYFGLPDRRFYGLRCPTPKTLDEIGVFLGVTRERVRQIKAAALDKIERDGLRRYAS